MIIRRGKLGHISSLFKISVISRFLESHSHCPSCGWPAIISSFPTSLHHHERRPTPSFTFFLPRRRTILCIERSQWRNVAAQTPSLTLVNEWGRLPDPSLPHPAYLEVQGNDSTFLLELATDSFSGVVMEIKHHAEHLEEAMRFYAFWINVSPDSGSLRRERSNFSLAL